MLSRLKALTSIIDFYRRFHIDVRQLGVLKTILIDPVMPCLAYYQTYSLSPALVNAGRLVFDKAKQLLPL